MECGGTNPPHSDPCQVEGTQLGMPAAKRMLSGLTTFSNDFSNAGTMTGKGGLSTPFLSGQMPTHGKGWVGRPECCSYLPLFFYTRPLLCHGRAKWDHGHVSFPKAQEK